MMDTTINVNELHDFIMNEIKHISSTLQCNSEREIELELDNSGIRFIIRLRKETHICFLTILSFINTNGLLTKDELDEKSYAEKVLVNISFDKQSFDEKMERVSNKLHEMGSIIKESGAVKNNINVYFDDYVRYRKQEVEYELEQLEIPRNLNLLDEALAACLIDYIAGDLRSTTYSIEISFKMSDDHDETFEILFMINYNSSNDIAYISVAANPINGNYMDDHLYGMDFLLQKYMGVYATAISNVSMLRADYYSKDEQGLYNLNVVFNILFDDLSKTIVNSLLTNCINKLTDQKFLTAIIRRREN